MLRTIADWIRRLWAPGFAFVALLCCSCSGSLERARSQPKLGASPATAERCNELDDRRALFGGAGKTLAVLGGGAGLATVATDDPTLDTGLAIGAVASGALAAGAVYVSEQSGTSWARECSAAPPNP